MKEEDPCDKSLRLLQKYLDETPKEEIDALFREIQESGVGSEGPTVEEYFKIAGVDVEELKREIDNENQE